MAYISVENAIKQAVQAMKDYHDSHTGGGSSTPQNVFYGTCDSLASDSVKAVACSGFPETLTAGMLLFVKFTNENTANFPSLSINSGTSTGISTASASPSFSGAWKAGQVVGFISAGNPVTWYAYATVPADSTHYGVVKDDGSGGADNIYKGSTSTAASSAVKVVNAPGFPSHSIPDGTVLFLYSMHGNTSEIVGLLINDIEDPIDVRRRAVLPAESMSGAWGEAEMLCMVYLADLGDFLLIGCEAEPESEPGFENPATESLDMNNFDISNIKELLFKNGVYLYSDSGKLIAWDTGIDERAAIEVSDPVTSHDAVNKQYLDGYTVDYETKVTGKPTIGGIAVSGNKSLLDYNIQKAISAAAPYKISLISSGAVGNGRAEILGVSYTPSGTEQEHLLERDAASMVIKIYCGAAGTTGNAYIRLNGEVISSGTGLRQYDMTVSSDVRIEWTTTSQVGITSRYCDITTSPGEAVKTLETLGDDFLISNEKKLEMNKASEVVQGDTRAVTADAVKTYVDEHSGGSSDTYDMEIYGSNPQTDWSFSQIAYEITSGTYSAFVLAIAEGGSPKIQLREQIWYGDAVAYVRKQIVTPWLITAGSYQGIWFISEVLENTPTFGGNFPVFKKFWIKSDGSVTATEI